MIHGIPVVTQTVMLVILLQPASGASKYEMSIDG
jgi:hypothetical protein